MAKANTKVIECPYCGMEIKVNVEATKVPKRPNKGLPHITCPGSGYPITKRKMTGRAHLTDSLS